MDDKQTTQFFPIPNHETMMKFLKNDEDFPKRKRDFESILFSVTSEEDLTQRQFQDALQTAILSREYLTNYKWPAQW